MWRRSQKSENGNGPSLKGRRHAGERRRRERRRPCVVARHRHGRPPEGEHPRRCCYHCAVTEKDAPSTSTAAVAERRWAFRRDTPLPSSHHAPPEGGWEGHRSVLPLLIVAEKRGSIPAAATYRRCRLLAPPETGESRRVLCRLLLRRERENGGWRGHGCCNVRLPGVLHCYCWRTRGNGKLAEALPCRRRRDDAVAPKVEVRSVVNWLQRHAGDPLLLPTHRTTLRRELAPKARWGKKTEGKKEALRGCSSSPWSTTGRRTPAPLLLPLRRNGEGCTVNLHRCSCRTEMGVPPGHSATFFAPCTAGRRVGRPPFCSAAADRRREERAVAASREGERRLERAWLLQRSATGSSPLLLLADEGKRETDGRSSALPPET
nr:hypothetical protein Iba_chr01aCG4550 [Ipomoea batatas]